LKETKEMNETKEFHILDYLSFVVKRKELFFCVFFASLVITYGSIYFFIEEQFEATATIIPREDDASSLAGGLLSSIKKIPFSLGSKSLSSEIDLYKTIIYSRTLMEDVIVKFDLVKIYKLDTTDVAHMEKAVKRLKSEVVTKETDESAFLISVRSSTPQRAAEMTNYIVKRMNDRIIDFKISRSRDSKEFLQKRVSEVAFQLRVAEDSLRAFQERTGLLDVKAQLQGILTVHASLETELTAKQVQLGILERLYGKESPQVKDLNVQIQEYKKELSNLRSKGDPGSPMIALKKLPRASVDYLRLYREVELNNLLMEFIVPLYEQSKIEEKKDYPVLQIVDYAIPPAKKTYPPRVLFALLGACSVTLLVLLSVMLRESIGDVTDSYWITLFKEIKHWDWNIRK
jgi:tyrosine-protein kinase Etk/Wzc